MKKNTMNYLENIREHRTKNDTSVPEYCLINKPNLLIALINLLQIFFLDANTHIHTNVDNDMFCIILCKAVFIYFVV